MRNDRNPESAFLVPRALWGPGPWQRESDKAAWIDGATGLPCVIFRNSVGALCGYVGVPLLHPLYGEHYLSPCFDHCSPHGGLTYSGVNRKFDAMADYLFPRWWVGFDCAHFNDLAPAMMAFMRNRDPNFPLATFGSDRQYRSFAYVLRECGGLAKALRQRRFVGYKDRLVAVIERTKDTWRRWRKGK